jgi:hypothetical protein
LPQATNVPEELWNIFPPRGQYIKHILKFSGYETIESVLKLRQKEELEKAFSFVKAVSEIVENKEEMLGIFYKNPDKLMLIPGHEVHLMEYTSPATPTPVLS